MVKKIMLWIVNTFWNFIYPEWTDAEVKAFYDKFSNYFELALYLQTYGFKYKPDGMNVLPIHRLDTFARPSQVLARKMYNCSDAMRLISEFIRYKKCADSIEEIFLYNGEIGNWHYIMIISDRGKQYIQSNIFVNALTPESMAEYKNDYKHWDVIDTWQR